MDEKEIIEFLEIYSKQETLSYKALPQSGSSRKNIIAENAKGKFVLTYNTNIAENKAFVYYSKLFSDLNLNTPKIFKVNKNQDLYIQSFLGEETLSEIIAEEGESERVTKLVKEALTKLYTLQNATSGKVDYSKTFEYSSYDERPILNDLFYFKNFFADILEMPYHKSNLISDFLELVKLLENLQPHGLMLRDFQSRNIMVDENENIFFIDYQAGMEGPLMYDVISFLFQAKANFSDKFKSDMLRYYINQWKDVKIKSQLRNSIEPLKLIRFLQVLGAYGFRGLVQKKEHFVESIPMGIENIQNLSISWKKMSQFPELKKLIRQINLDTWGQDLEIRH